MKELHSLVPSHQWLFSSNISHLLLSLSLFAQTVILQVDDINQQVRDRQRASYPLFSKVCQCLIHK